MLFFYYYIAFYYCLLLITLLHRLYVTLGQSFKLSEVTEKLKKKTSTEASAGGAGAGGNAAAGGAPPNGGGGNGGTKKPKNPYNPKKQDELKLLCQARGIPIGKVAEMKERLFADDARLAAEAGVKTAQEALVAATNAAAVV